MLFAACTVYRITEWVRLEGTIVGSLVWSPSQGHPRAQGTRLHPGVSWISSMRETPQPLWAFFSSKIFHCVLPSFTLVYFLLKTLLEERKQSNLAWGIHLSCQDLESFFSKLHISLLQHWGFLLFLYVLCFQLTSGRIWGQIQNFKCSSN